MQSSLESADEGQTPSDGDQTPSANGQVASTVSKPPSPPDSVFYSIVTAVLLCHLGLLIWAAVHDAPTADEAAHLIAGVAALEHGNHDIEPANGPVVRYVAALPVWLRLGESLDPRGHLASDNYRQASKEFRAVNDRRLVQLVRWARYACLSFSIIGAMICLTWATELFGRPAGIMALMLWCFSPNILGHGHLITADVAAAALGAAACFAFYHWLRKRSWSSAAIAGAVLGVVELTKLFMVVLYFVWPVVWFLASIVDERRRSWRFWARGATQMVLIYAASFYIINVGYGFNGTLMPLRDLELASLVGAEDDAIPAIIGSIYVPFPKAYLAGFDTIERRFDQKTWSYLRGEWQQTGWWYYYLYGFFVKVPIGTLSLLIIGGILAFARKTYRADPSGELMLVMATVLLMTCLCLRSGFGRHFRYALPILPFVFILTSRVAICVGQKSLALRSVVAVLFGWFIISSVAVYPHSLSYFNGFAGGPRNGHGHLVDSNIDWGQDLLRLEDWLDENPQAHPLRLAYFGAMDPQYARIAYKLPPCLDQTILAQQPPPEQLAELTPGWYAVSVNFLRGYRFRAFDGMGGYQRITRPGFGYFMAFEPDEMIGYSIYIYHLDENDIQSLQRNAIGNAE